MKRTFLIIVGLIIIASLAFFGFKAVSSRQDLTIFTVSRGTIAEEVAVTGKTKFRQVYRLSVDRAGRVGKIKASIGDTVKKNQVLMEFENGRSGIVSPAEGVLVKIDIKEGDVATPNTPVMQVVASGEKEIETFISQTDISRVRIDNPVDIIFDAFPDETFKGEVSQIDWVETMLDGVAHYRIIVKPATQDERILSGFSANVSIITSERKNVLLLPDYLITERDGEAFVLKYEDSKTTEKTVKTGKQDQYGNIEIIEGLREGDQVAQENSKK